MPHETPSQEMPRRGVLGRLLAFAAALPALLAPRPAAATTQRWICTYNECEHYVYDPLHGDPDDVAGVGPIPAGVAFEALPEGWRCPICGSPKAWFEPTDKPWKPIA